MEARKRKSNVRRGVASGPGGSDYQRSRGGTTGGASDYIRQHRTLVTIVVILFMVQLFVFAVFYAAWNPPPARREPAEPKEPTTLKTQKSEPSEAPKAAPLSADKTGNQMYLEKATCSITSKEALSALNRAKTHDCKSEIVRLACLSQEEMYPSELVNTCPMLKSASFEKDSSHLGCFKDSFNDRILKGKMPSLKATNSRRQCFEACSTWGYAFAGVQYGHECFCGDEFPKADLRIEDSSCNYTCSGQPEEMCGGYLAVNIFKTNVNKTAHQPANVQPLDGNTARIVYLLTLNGRASRQVRRLIKRLYDGRNYIYIHVDSRQDYLFREMKAIEALFPQTVYVTSDRHASIWGGASLLTMLLGCMRDLLTNRGHWSWDYVINLSESDYPVKSGADLVQYLTRNAGRNFVKSHGLTLEKFVKKQGLDKTFFECERRMWRLGSRELPRGIQYDGGSDWVGLHIDFVRYLIHEVNTDPLLKGLKSVYDHALLPAESYFHTVLRNSRFCQTYLNNNLHLTNWRRDRGCKCQHKKVVDWCGCSPNDFLPEDWKRLEGTSSKEGLFFARKFEASVSQDILDMIDDWTFPQFHNLDNDPNFNKEARKSFWQNIYHHEDQSPPADPAFLELANSLAQITLTERLQVASNQPLPTYQVTEVTSHYRDDDLVGIVVSFRAELEGAWSQFECLVRVGEGISTLSNSVEIDFREGRFGVGTQWDPKELMFRNVFGFFGPKHQPELEFSFGPAQSEPDSNFTARAVFVDPNNNIAGTAVVNLMNSTKFSDMVKPSQLEEGTKTTGIWTVIIFDSILSKALTSLHFLVLGGSEDTNKQPAILEEVSEQLRKAVSDVILTSRHTKQIQSINMNLNQQKTEAVKLFYTIQDVCRVSASATSTIHFNSCQETQWSTIYPDHKSTISSFDAQSGMLT